MKKKITALCLCVALLAVAVVGASLAYFTDTKTAKNEFTVGDVSIELTEPLWESSGKADADTVYAGEPLKKDPTVKNTGTNPCFVRIKVEGLNQFGTKGDITYRTNYVVGALGNDWTYSNGYFYYTKVLQNGEKTSALFDSIVMPTGLVGGETASPITVTAQAVQAQGAKARWADVQAMTVAEIAAWFTTCGMD